MSQQSKSAEPPKPPEFKKHFALPTVRWFGMPIIALIPILSLLGVIGEKDGREEQRLAGLDVSVTYPERALFSRETTFQVIASNVSGSTLRDVHVILSAPYLANFAITSLAPDSEKPFDFTFDSLSAGDSAIVQLEILPVRTGRHEGTLTVGHEGGPPATIDFVSTILP